MFYVAFNYRGHLLFIREFRFGQIRSKEFRTYDGACHAADRLLLRQASAGNPVHTYIIPIKGASPNGILATSTTGRSRVPS